MFFAPTIEHFKLVAREDFDQIHRKGTVLNALSMILPGQHALTHLDDVRGTRRLESLSDVGVQTVEIKAIHGSESRPKDFDRNWRPLKSSNMERWVNIAVAQSNSISMPAVELIKVGDAYYVRDGHHRISVAKHQGQVEMEAYVTEWHLSADDESAAAGQDSNHALAFVKPVIGQVKNVIGTGGERVMVSLRAMRREVVLRLLRPMGRLQNPIKSSPAT